MKVEKPKSAYRIGEDWEKHCEEILQKGTFITWRPRKSRSFRRGEKGGTDIFGLFDLIASDTAGLHLMRLIQCKKNKHNITPAVRAELELFPANAMTTVELWYDEQGIAIERWNSASQKWEKVV